MKKTQVLVIVNMLALTMQISLSYLTQLRLVNDQDVGQVSDSYDLSLPRLVSRLLFGVLSTRPYYFFASIT